MIRFVDTAAECTVKQFKECCFSEKYSMLILEGEPTKEELIKAFEFIYAQYVDMSGLFVSREFELSGYIHSLYTRKNTIERFVEWQKKFIDEFGFPFVTAFGIVKRYGHHLKWNPAHPNVSGFIVQLDKMVLKEKKYHSEIKAKEQDLLDMQKKRKAGEHSLLESRRDFITMLNRLQQERFVIDQNTTTVEELAYMIRDQRDQQEEERAQQYFKRRKK